MNNELTAEAILARLGREPVDLDVAAVADFVRGRTVMVTGAGGSIGSELSRQVASLGASRLLLVERSESALFEIDRELAGQVGADSVRIDPLVADVADVARMRGLFERFRPQVVLHAAAHKHVPLMETNAGEAVRNNVFGTRVVGDLAGEFAAEAFVLVSTDKAVRPTSVMGASKRVAEIVIQDLDRRYSTRYSAVRFGNVVGSTGSVVPIFREQILSGGPVTLTDRGMRRYFMTIPEASHLVLCAGAMGQGGEIFILDMGEPVSIVDLAEAMIALAGLRPGIDIEIVATGVRPGEKLAEELTMSSEGLTTTSHPRIRLGQLSSYPEAEVVKAMRRLGGLVADDREAELRAFLNELLPEANVAVEPSSRS